MRCCLLADPEDVPTAGALEAVARACSPRVERRGERAVVFDVSGLSRAIGSPATIAEEVARLAHDQGLRAPRVALAPAMSTAWVLAHVAAGPTVVPTGGDAAALGAVPISWLASLIDLDFDAPDPGARGGARAAAERRRSEDRYRDCLATFGRWGIRTVGELAALPRADVHARMGGTGVRLHHAACGEDEAPLVPDGERVRFADRLELEWPIDGLEPLSFVLARQCDRLSNQLERADRGAVGITTHLRLVTRETHTRVLTLPAPMRDARVLRTLVMLDLESHPPAAAIDIVDIELAVTPGRIVQGSLLARTLPAPEDVATLLARLGALVGETRVGAPALVDSHDTRQYAIVPFRIIEAPRKSFSLSLPDVVEVNPTEVGRPGAAVRRFRLPVSARVTVEQGLPVEVYPSAPGLRGGMVVRRAGPWRSSGQWWSCARTAWDRDEWDIEVSGGVVYRMARHRPSGQWDIEGTHD